MKKNALKSPKQTGFTLIELLVVIAIMVTLAGLGVSAYRTAINKANEVAAHAAMSNLTSACDSFFDDYSRLPLTEGANGDQERLSDNQLMSILVGLESGEDENPKLQSYFTYTAAKGKGAHKYSGLDRSDTRAKLYGPWKNKNETERFYRLKFDYDYDQEITESQSVGGKTHYDRRVLIHHLGRDGVSGQGKNSDNVYNYK